MYDSYKAEEAQRKYCSEHNAPMFAPSSRVGFRCFRCGQNIYSESGHPVAEKLPRGRVRLDYSKSIPGYSVEDAGKELICGCPFCCRSFDD